MTAETILVADGAEFSVSLASASGAGYVWTVDDIPAGLLLLGNTSAAPAAGAAPGAPMVQTFHWRAEAKGGFTLRFVLKRPWEREPVDTHTATVQVN